ncbi:YjbE family putative metal transport protein [Aristophania vespae]|uniref:YjbE family putative metal transport protein n=1 Tax=Aristophania vespae TaxID=2697033 RepID=UPI0023512FEA|nr:YjbE family putative metal transport protein [Aristophania vespae]UMM63055.1 hypothetical protein DM15PD_00080 [Aristophania vespae]
MTIVTFLNSLSALIAVFLIDFALAGSNIAIIAFSVQRLNEKQKWTAILSGTVAGAVLRIALALIANHLLKFEGLKLIGGLLLFWICWKTFINFRNSQDNLRISDSSSVGEAILQIIIADLALSFDNVIAVAGAAEKHPLIMTIGLIISVIIIALAANIATWFLKRFKWLNWVGLFIVLVVGLKLFMQGIYEIWKLS